MRRDGQLDDSSQRIPAPVAARLFQLKLGEIGLAAVGEGYLVIKLTEILAADPAVDQAGVKRLSDSLTQNIAGEIGQQYVRALRDRLQVVINPEAVERLYQN